MDLGILPEFDATYQRRIGVLDPAASEPGSRNLVNPDAVLQEGEV